MNSYIKDFYYSIFPETREYLEYKEGNTNILLSAPHGGNIKPYNIPDRTYGNRGRDTYTRTLIKKIINNLSENPYYIYANIHRRKIDLNRNIVEATQGNSIMESVWKTWNYTITTYLDEIKLHYNKILYIDIHSHNKSNNFELGYGINVDDYWKIKDNLEPEKHSTLFELVDKDVNEFGLLFGEFSIESTLKSFNYKVLSPKSDSTYLNGGRNINKFSGNGVGSIQIECPIPILKENINGVAEAIIVAIEKFKLNLM